MMLDDECPKDIVTPQFEKVRTSWDRLEIAHDSYIESIVGEIDDADLNRLDEPSARYHAVLKRYSDFIKHVNNNERAQLQQIDVDNREADKLLRRQLALEKKEAETISRNRRWQRDTSLLRRSSRQESRCSIGLLRAWMYLSRTLLIL